MKTFASSWWKHAFIFKSAKLPPAFPLAPLFASACVPLAPPLTLPLASPHQNGLCLADSHDADEGDSSQNSPFSRALGRFQAQIHVGENDAHC
jgi:hypothetical protein